MVIITHLTLFYALQGDSNLVNGKRSHMLFAATLANLLALVHILM